MIQSLQGCYNQRIKPWDIFAQDFRPPPAHPLLAFGPPLHGDTVRAYMNKAGYHKCWACQKSWISDDNAKKRVNWCKEHKWAEWQWKLVSVSAFLVLFTILIPEIV